MKRRFHYRVEHVQAHSLVAQQLANRVDASKFRGVVQGAADAGCAILKEQPNYRGVVVERCLVQAAVPILKRGGGPDNNNNNNMKSTSLD